MRLTINNRHLLNNEEEQSQSPSLIEDRREGKGKESRKMEGYSPSADDLLPAHGRHLKLQRPVSCKNAVRTCI